MDTTRATAKRVEDVRVSRGLNRKDLAEAAGISRPTLYRSLDGFRPFTVDEIDRLGRALDIEPASLLRFVGPDDAKAVAS